MNPQRKQYKVLLIGDSCYDRYLYGSVTRINPEAPIPILDKLYTVTKHGMATNVYNNLINLGCDVDIVTAFVQTKTRYVDDKSKQQILRVDSPIINHTLDRNQLPNFNLYDCIVISDYDKNYLTYEDIEYIINKSSVQVFVDTKKPDLFRFKGATLKLNQYEWESRASDHDDCIVTYGGDKVTYRGKEYFPPKVEPHDVCGAGDTFLAAFAFSNDVNFAMKAAAVTVQHLGVYAPLLEEIQ